MACRTRFQTSNGTLKRFIHGLIRPGKDVCKGCNKFTIIDNEKLGFDFNSLVMQVSKNWFFKNNRFITQHSC